MSWLDELIPASLNGVPFFVQDSTKTGGRRTRAHEFADVDGAWVEDSGGLPHRWQLAAFVIGPEYHVTLQELEEVLDLGGDLDLDHPRRGPIGGLRLEGTYETVESTEQGGYARVSFTLVQGGQPEPLIFDSIPAEVKVAARRARAAAVKQFKKKYSGRNLFGSALRLLRRLSGGLKKIYGKVMSAFGPISSLASAIDAFDSAIDQIVNLPGDIADLFRDLAASFMNLFAKKAKDLGRPEGAAKLLADSAKESIDANKTPEATSDYDSVVGSDGTPSGKALVAKADLDALEVLWGTMVMASLCETIVDLPLPNADAADLLSQIIAAELDLLLGAEVGAGPVDSDLYDALLDIKITVADVLTEVGGQLPPVTTYTPPSPVNLITAAFHQGGVTGKALSDLVKSMFELNDIDDPFVIDDGTPLKVVLQ